MDINRQCLLRNSKVFCRQSLNITSLTECLVCEVTIQNEKGYIAVVYRRPSQNISEFESFLSGLDDLLSNIFCSKTQFTAILGDCNVRSPYLT